LTYKRRSKGSLNPINHNIQEHMTYGYYPHRRPNLSKTPHVPRITVVPHSHGHPLLLIIVINHLTKDNLGKRNWKGNKQCSLCLMNEYIHHLFYNCYYARFLWGLAQITFDIIPSHNTNHIFGSWTNSVAGKLKIQLLPSALTFC
jgi:hypothetical protein